METTKVPYELLVRFDQSGKLQGAQVQYRYIIRDGEKIVGESVGNAEPLSLDKGFPLQDVLTNAQADALATAEDAKRDAERARADLAQARSVAETARQEAAEARSETKQMISEHATALSKAENEIMRLKKLLSATAAP